MSRTTLFFGLALLALVATGMAASGAFAATPAEVAQREYDRALSLEPNHENGRRVYLTCAVCHLPEGWGRPDGIYPQIAGQLRTVIIKQLADFRAGNRDNPLMFPFSVPEILGSAQEIADVAEYVSRLLMTPRNGVGPGTDLERGAKLYQQHCAECHGDRGQGKMDEHVPAIAGQHYLYLVRQFDNIRNGSRKNSDPEMVRVVKHFSREEESATLDYTARLRPPAHKLAPEGWINPDFPGFVRDAMIGLPPPPPPPPIPPRVDRRPEATR